MSSKFFDHAGLIAGTGLATLCLWYATRPSIPLPPGPKGNLILGSALDLRNSSAFWKDFARYSEQYGPIITVRMLFAKFIIVDDPKLAAELLEKRGAQYSNRLVSQLAKVAGWDRDITFLPYGPIYKRYRTLLQRALNNRVALDYLPLQQHESKRLLRRLLETPEKFVDHIKLMAASVAIRMVYGYRVTAQDDPLVRNAEEYIKMISDMFTPGKWMIEIFPLLRYLPAWFPGATFHKAIAAWAPMVYANREETFDYVKRQLAAGTAEPSFVSKLLQPEGGEKLSAEEETDIKILAASLYGAASDTIVSMLSSFFLAMTLYPDVQAKAQAEITAYLETQLAFAHDLNQPPRFLTMADRQKLPYTSSLARELLRWHPVATLLVRKTNEQDDNNVVVDGKTYRIPARSTVLVNIWNILQNPEIYPEPEKFIPERYLVVNPPPGPEMYAFGFGRRVCPGTHVAQQELWLCVSNILANFTTTKAKDENGVEIVPEERYTNGISSHPLPFKCNIQPREGCAKWLSEIED